MADLLARLQHALAHRYAVERELGRGGMSIVFLARDQKHDRLVALKVLREELLGALGPERFLREIQLTARLAHPHILPLHDSGEAGGLLYYVMPYVEGESLRSRLTREQQLPLDDVIRITSEVADALQYAYQHGVVHRDIKPENILLTGDHALVLDFGVARAIAAAGQRTLTNAGVAVGTPSYMSPEQAAGESELDARSDLYGLACVTYEMLVGEPPFTGRTPQAILARHLSDPPPSLRTIRPAIPEGVERAVQKALAKTPADRFASAAEFATTLEAATAQDRTPRRRPRSAAPAVLLVALALGAASVVGWLVLRARQSGHESPATRDNLVAVLPFRVSASEPTLGFLREGMLDLLAARLTGEVGPRAVEPRTLLSSWRRAARGGNADLSEEAIVALARSLGAVSVLSGSVVSSPRGLIVQAALAPVPPSRRAPTVASVEGPLDSLTPLVDALAAQLLAREAGESGQRLETFTTTSLPALRAYLEGETNYRQGSYEAAVRAFRRALAMDSGFALAGLALRNAAAWSTYSATAAAEGVALAWRFRQRLGERDRAFLLAVVGPHYPSPPTYAEQLDSWEHAVAVTPDRAEAWFEVGDLYMHFGPLLDLDDALGRSAAAMGRALALDSAFEAPLQHLYDIAALQADTAGVRRLGALLLTRALGGTATIARWQMALALGDTAALSNARHALDSLALGDLFLVPFYAQIAAVWSGNAGIDDAEHAADLLLRRSTTREEREIAAGVQRTLALNRGRPEAALRAGETLGDRTRVLDALYWQGDTAAAAMSVRRLVQRPGRNLDVADRCTLGQWQLWHGDGGSSAGAITGLRATSAGKNSGATSAANLCAALLTALQGVLERQGDAHTHVQRLDSLLRQGPSVGMPEAGLVLARLREAEGDLAGALVAARRRPLAPGGELFLSTYLETEGRLAELTGYRDEAIHSYQHYLALRSAPEPARAADVARVRAGLARLLAAPGPASRN